MADLEIHRFGPDDTDDVRVAFEITNSIAAADAPWEHPWLEGRFDTFLRRGWDGEPPACYLASVDGKPVGNAFVFYSERDNTHLGWAWLGILPEHRRQGYGSELFEHVVSEIRAAGRTSIGTDGWESERALGFAAKHGLEKRSQAIMRRQHLHDLPPGKLQELYDESAAAASDYELVRIVGRTPEDLVGAMVELVSAINDAPTDDLDIEDEVFSPERLAAYEEAAMARGEPALPAGGTAQGDRRAGRSHRHRGGGAAAARSATSTTPPSRRRTAATGWGCSSRRGCCSGWPRRSPRLATVDTWNAESNDHMIAVNEALGYVVLGREMQFQKSL